jgi:stage II sporulation protein D
MRMYRKLVVGLVFILGSQITILPSQATGIPESFAFSGSGYGHGVGMSQMGARAKAVMGESATAILNYYYSGTKVETITDTQILRINVGHLLTSAKFRSDSEGVSLKLYAGDISETATVSELLTIPAKSTITATLNGSIMSVSTTIDKKSSLVALGKTFTVRWSGTRYLDGPPSVLTLTHGSKAVKYRYGQMQFKVVKNKVHGQKIEITNSVRLNDEYLWGVSEVPSSWPSAALQAQAIAARTYAIARSTVIRSACDCHMYNSISDQTFAGFSKEIEPRFGIFWKQAVTQTSGMIITHSGVPISAYYSSSTGGVTETSRNAWGTSTPYTLSVSDSASTDIKLNPRFASWQRSLTQKVIADSFLLPDVATLEVVMRNSTGTVGQIRATSLSGTAVVLRGETFRSRTKLPSAWFNLSAGLS